MGTRKGKSTIDLTEHNGENNNQDLIKFLEADKGFEALFYSSSIPKALSDLTSEKFVAVNKAFERFTGYKYGEVIGSTAANLNLVEIEHRTFEREELEDKESLKSYEADILLKNGERKAILFSFHKIIVDKNEYVLSQILDVADLKKTQALLKTEKEFSQNVLSSLREGLSAVNLEGIHIEVNPALCEMTGFSKEELIGSKPPYLYWPPEEYDNINLAFKKTLTGEIGTANLIFMRKNEERFPVSLAISSVKDGNGNVIAYFSTVNDTTQQLQAEEELRQAKDFSEELVISLRQGLVVMNIDGEIIDVNPAFCAITEFKKEELLGTTAPFSFWPPEAYEAIQACLKRTLSGEVGNFEFLFMRKSGERFTASLATSSIKDKQGDIIAFFVTIDDISDRVRAQTEIRIAKEFSENVLASMYEGLLIVSIQDSRITSVNPSFCRMTGYSEAEILATTAPFPFWAPEYFDSCTTYFKNTLKEDSQQSFEAIYKHKNGKRFPVQVISSRILDNKGKAISLLATIRDVSEQVKAKNLLKETAENSNLRKNTMLELTGLVGVDFEEAITKITSLTAKTLGIDRVSVWKFSDNRSEMYCEKLYSQSKDAFFSDMILKKLDNPAYFEALTLNRTISVTNTFENDITKAFTDDYLKPNNISSLIDVFIQGLGGEYGVVCFEHVGPCRIWTAEDEEFASSIANLVSLMVQSSERIAVESKLKIANSDLFKAVEELEGFKSQLEKENIYLRDELDMVFNFEEMVYGSAVFSEVLTDVEKVAPTIASVLLLGETGTGKELLARAIHKTSDRKNKPLIKLNCAAIPRELIESELFGHKKGSFTGAGQDKIGKVELAHGGTLFLDEIGELPISMQPKLLRFLQEGEIEKIGETTSKKLDVRIIAATNRDLKLEIKEHRFREDLYYRLNVFPITVPPLRERQEDIPLLVEHFVDKFGKMYNKNVKYVSDVAMREMQNYNWPGNIRELENLIERGVILSSTEHLVITDFDLSTESTKRLISSTNLSLDESQRLHIIRVLEKCNWMIDGADGAANLLKIKPSTLRDRMKKLKINRPD